MKSASSASAAKTVLNVTRVGLCPPSVKPLKTEWTLRGFLHSIKVFINFVLEQTVSQVATIIVQFAEDRQLRFQAL